MKTTAATRRARRRALAPAAGAGGWATVQLSAVPTDGMKAGTTLPIDITVLQHGRTPLDGVTPVFRIRDGKANVLAEYQGTPTGAPGVYHVDVTFPEPPGSSTTRSTTGSPVRRGADPHVPARRDRAARRRDVPVAARRRRRAAGGCARRARDLPRAAQSHRAAGGAPGVRGGGRRPSFGAAGGPPRRAGSSRDFDTIGA